MVIFAAPIFFMYLALKRVNSVPSNAANIPYIYPLRNVLSVPNIYANAIITMIPIIISCNEIFLLKNKGSINAANREEVAKQTTAIETLDTLID